MAEFLTLSYYGVPVWGYLLVALIWGVALGMARS
jgi:hypothetical protein